MGITHVPVVAVADDGSIVGTNAWNAGHTIIQDFNAQTGTTYTLQVSDSGKVVTLDNAGSITLTCPAGLGAGFSCTIMQLGAGQVGVVASGGATVNSYLGLVHLAGQYASGVIMAPTANNFILGGQTA